MVSQEDKPLILELAKAGLSASAIAQKFNATRLDVLAVCAEAGQLVKHYKKPDSSLERTVEILLRRGYSAHEVRRRTGIDRSFVRVVRAKLGFIGLPPSYIERMKSNRKKAAIVDQLAASGMTKREACKQVGISPQVYYEAKQIAA